MANGTRGKCGTKVYESVQCNLQDDQRNGDVTVAVGWIFATGEAHQLKMSHRKNFQLVNAPLCKNSNANRCKVDKLSGSKGTTVGIEHSTQTE